MRSSPQPLRDGGGDTPSPHLHHHHHRSPAAAANSPFSPHHDIRFHSTLSAHKLKRLNSLILLFRVATFVFSLSSFVFMLTNSRSSPQSHWFDFDAFRFVLAANGIVAVYSLVEMVTAVWEITTGVTLFPEVYQVWFDFGHDQVWFYCERVLWSLLKRGVQWQLSRDRWNRGSISSTYKHPRPFEPSS